MTHNSQSFSCQGLKSVLYFTNCAMLSALIPNIITNTLHIPDLLLKKTPKKQNSTLIPEQRYAIFDDHWQRKLPADVWGGWKGANESRLNESCIVRNRLQTCMTCKWQQICLSFPKSLNNIYRKSEPKSAKLPLLRFSLRHTQSPTIRKCRSATRSFFFPYWGDCHAKASSLARGKYMITHHKTVHAKASKVEQCSLSVEWRFRAHWWIIL